MSHRQEENWVTGKTRDNEAHPLTARSIWTPVDEYDFYNEHREKYIEAGWKSYLLDKGIWRDTTSIFLSANYRRTSSNTS